MSAIVQGVVLVPGDLSRHGVQALWRAGLVARDLGGSLRVLHVAAAASVVDAEDALRRQVLTISKHLGVPAELRVAGGEPLAAIVQAAREATLVVLGSSQRNALREWLLGTPAERLLRLCRVPVLVVKREAKASYRRVLVPVLLSPAAGEVIAAAARLSRQPRFEVLHALRLDDEPTMRALDLPPWVLRRHRDRAAQRARGALQELIAQADWPAGSPQPMVGFGDAAAVALTRERALCAELLVVGKRTRGLLADFVLGSVTQRLLARSRCDVLVLPLQAPGAPSARTPAPPATGASRRDTPAPRGAPSSA